MRNLPQAGRKPASSPARLVLADGTSVPCTVVNLSAGGARIDVDLDAVVPDVVHLAAEDLHIACEATVAWRTGARLGLRFGGDQSPARSRREGSGSWDPLQRPFTPA